MINASIFFNAAQLGNDFVGGTQRRQAAKASRQPRSLVSRPPFFAVTAQSCKKHENMFGILSGF